MKNTLFALCLALAGTTGHSQVFERLFPSKDKFDFTVRAGLNLSNPEYKTEHGQKTSFYAGFGGQYDFKKVTLTFGVEYADNGTEDNSGYVTAINAAQLNVPVTLKVYPADIFYLEAGGYAGFVLNAEGETADGLTVELDEFEDMDYGLLAGAGIDLGSFFIEAQYNFGLKHMIDLPADFDPDFDPIVGDSSARIKDYKNRFFQLGVGFYF